MHPDLAQRLVAIGGLDTATLRAALLDGAAALDQATGEQPGGPPRLRAALVRAEAEHLIFGTRLIQVWSEVRGLSAEVWDLERSVTAEHPTDPPARIPGDLPTPREIAVTVDADVRAAAATAEDAAATGDPLVVLLSYAVATREVAHLDDASVAGRVVDAGGRAATAKYELTQAMDMRTHLTLRRAGLRGMKEAADRREPRSQRAAPEG